MRDDTRLLRNTCLYIVLDYHVELITYHVEVWGYTRMVFSELREIVLSLEWSD